jgi:hypothetical protein
MEKLHTRLTDIELEILALDCFAACNHTVTPERRHSNTDNMYCTCNWNRGHS